MLDALGPTYDGGLSSSDGASAGLPRPDRRAERVGARRRAQHRVPTGRRARHRDERARVGVQRRARARDGGRSADRRDALPLEHMRAAQRVAFDALRPGVTCGRRPGRPPPFRENGIFDTWSQHTGHAIGLRNHEAPFLDVGDDGRGSRGWCSPSSPGSTRRRTPGLPPLGHCRAARRDRDPHGLPERDRRPVAAALTVAHGTLRAMDAWRAHVLRQNS